jgi:NAD(P)-dependent dehydrogenase (short-subunit alcohol dehydrogenase family)
VSTHPPSPIITATPHILTIFAPRSPRRSLNLRSVHLPPPLPQPYPYSPPPSLACDKTASPTSYTPLVTRVSQSFPNTRLIPYPFDVTSEDATLSLIDESLAAFGRLDVWVCSSGLLGPASVHDTTPDDLSRCFEAHSLAPFFALKHVPAAMGKLTEEGERWAYPNATPKRQKYGSIVVVSSVAGGYGGCWGPAYTMACHAAMGVVRAGVKVLKGSGVRINAVSPGQVDVGVDLQGVSCLFVLWGGLRRRRVDGAVMVCSEEEQMLTVRFSRLICVG